MITYTTDNPDELLGVMYAQYKTETPPGYNFETFKEDAAKFSPVGILLRGELIGIYFLSVENEIHWGIIPKYRKRWAGKWVKQLFATLAQKQDLVTICLTGDKAREQFITRMGFKVYLTLRMVTIFRFAKGGI